MSPQKKKVQCGREGLEGQRKEAFSHALSELYTMCPSFQSQPGKVRMEHPKRYKDLLNGERLDQKGNGSTTLPLECGWVSEPDFQ